jgi:hypothetical protein
MTQGNPLNPSETRNLSTVKEIAPIRCPCFLLLRKAQRNKNEFTGKCGLEQCLSIGIAGSNVLLINYFQLFIYCLFNNALKSPGLYSDEWCADYWEINRNLCVRKTSFCSLRVCSIIYVEELKEKKNLSYAVLKAEIWTRNLPNKNKIWRDLSSGI